MTVATAPPAAALPRPTAAIWVGVALSLMTFVYYAVVTAGVALQLAFLTFVAASCLLLSPGALRLALPVVAAYGGIQIASLVVNIWRYDLSGLLVALVDTCNVSLSLIAGIIIARAAPAVDTRRIFAVCAVLVAALMVAALAIHWPERFGGRFMGHGLHPNWWGSVAYGTACCAIFISRWYVRWPVMLTSIAMCLETSSRSSIIAIALIIGLTAAWRFRPTVRNLVLIFLVAIPGLCLAWLMAGDAIANFLLNRVLQVDSIYRGLDTGFTGRTEGWAHALRMFESSPLLGIGPNNLPEVHNGYLIALGETGVPGFLFFSAVLALPVFVRGAGREAAIVVLSYAVFVFFAPRTFNLVLGSFIPTLLAMQGYVALMSRRGGLSPDGAATPA